MLTSQYNTLSAFVSYCIPTYYIVLNTQFQISVQNLNAPEKIQVLFIDKNLDLKTTRKSKSPNQKDGGDND